MSKTRLTALFLSLLMTLCLCACGGASSADLGKYTCTSIVMNGLDLGAGEEWVELKEDGAAVLFVQNEAQTAAYTMSGNTITLTNMNGQELGTGTMEGGELTINLMGMTCIFQKEGGNG